MVLKADDGVQVKLDWLKWLLSLTLLLAGLVGNHYYSEVSTPVRTLCWLAVLAMAGFVASKTQKGKWVLEFFRDSKAELKKVSWPTKDETMRTTMIVAVMVVILALILWGMDGILVWLIGFLTGQHS